MSQNPSIIPILAFFCIGYPTIKPNWGWFYKLYRVSHIKLMMTLVHLYLTDWNLRWLLSLTKLVEATFQQSM